jgi:CHAT domain-containing protein
MIEREIETLKGISDRLRQVDVCVIEHATPKALLEELQTGVYQILHFAGHADRSDLILEDEKGHQARLGVLDLAPVISGSALTMVFLNACETAGSGFRPGIPSLASMLANKGVPLVLAMQHEIPNDDALSFVRSFYDALVDTGSVDDAVSRGRQVVFSRRESVTPPTWAIPVLLVRGSNSELMRPLPRWRRGLGLRRQPIQKGGKL